jgi:hypothetical protein
MCAPNKWRSSVSNHYPSAHQTLQAKSMGIYNKWWQMGGVGG